MASQVRRAFPAAQVFFVAPLPRPDLKSEELSVAYRLLPSWAKKEGVEVIGTNVFDRAVDFRKDGVHLNSQGQAKLIQQVRRIFHTPQNLTSRPPTQALPEYIPVAGSAPKPWSYSDAVTRAQPSTVTIPTPENRMEPPIAISTTFAQELMNVMQSAVRQAVRSLGTAV